MNDRFDYAHPLPAGNTLSRQEITDKALNLAAYSGGANPTQMLESVNALWQVVAWPQVGPLLTPQLHVA